MIQLDSEVPTRRELSRLLSHLYAEAPAKQRLMAAGRPWISPLERVIAALPHEACHLDMGCGVGFMLAACAQYRRPKRIVGVDVDTKALDLARDVMRKSFPSCSAVVRTLYEWEHSPQETFDAISIVDVIHHVPVDQRKALLIRLARQVSPGGVLIYKDINQRPRWAAKANYLHDRILTGERVVLMPVSEVENLLEEQSLELVHSEDSMRLWYPHQLRVFRRSNVAL
ncbi:MAG TPA: class I SAM-dependent methyltransferase [Xanthobacteraceae bacterium]|nr:class I SAM-dependent methyltransferase [Xanthobacteraceae bacterium]